MTENKFLAGVTGRDDDFHLAVEALRASGQPFCLIDGLAVNHYAEPMVTLDADFAVAAAPGLAAALRERGFEVREFAHSINAVLSGSRLRLQITVNSRYTAFPERATESVIFGVRVPVASLPDLIQGKIWAMQDETRRASKRLKDRADITRLCETCPEAIALVPPDLIPEVDELRKKS